MLLNFFFSGVKSSKEFLKILESKNLNFGLVKASCSKWSIIFRISKNETTDLVETGTVKYESYCTL